MNISQIERQLSENALIIRQLQSMQKMQSSADTSADFDAIQSRADEALSKHGKRAGPPLLGEPAHVYRRRMASQLQDIAPKWQDFPLSGGVRDDAFEAIESQVYADAAEAAKNPVVPDGELRCIPKIGPGGHKINEYYGQPSSWMNNIAGPVRSYVKSFRGVS